MTLLKYFTLLSVIVLFCFFTPLTKLDTDSSKFISPCSLLSAGELLNLINVENANDFNIEGSTITPGLLKSCTYGMETNEGEDFMIDFLLWHIDDIENSPMSNLETLVPSGYTYETFSSFDNAIYIEKRRILILKKNKYVVQLEFTGFFYDEILLIGQLVSDRLPS